MSKDKGNKSVNKKTILRILKYIKRYRFLVVLSLICAAISVVLTLYAPIIMGHAVAVSYTHLTLPTKLEV